MNNSAVRQGSPGATQTQNVNINVDEAKAAIAALEAHIASLGLPADKLSDLHNDLATIKAQLAKTTPSHSILGEAAHSIRNITERTIEEALSPTVTGAIMELGKALGAF
jgi:hypothetical protein